MIKKKVEALQQMDYWSSHNILHFFHALCWQVSYIISFMSLWSAKKHSILTVDCTLSKSHSFNKSMINWQTNILYIVYKYSAL